MQLKSIAILLALAALAAAHGPESADEDLDAEALEVERQLRGSSSDPEEQNYDTSVSKHGCGCGCHHHHHHHHHWGKRRKRDVSSELVDEHLNDDGNAELEEGLEERGVGAISKHGCRCHCHLHFGFGKRRKRDVISQLGRRSPPEGSSDIRILGSAVELELYKSSEKIVKLMSTGVVLAELYERPLAAGVPKSIAGALGGKQLGVVTTLSDGRKFLVVKGNQLGRGRRTILILYDHMADDWVKVRSKKVDGAKLADFVHAGGQRYDPLTDNGRHAAERMMELF